MNSGTRATLLGDQNENPMVDDMDKIEIEGLEDAAANRSSIRATAVE